MNRRQLFLSTARAALASAFGGSWLGSGGSTPASAQTPATASVAAGPTPAAPQIYGVPGSPGATMTIDGRYLPNPPLPIRVRYRPPRHGLEGLVAAANRDIVPTILEATGIAAPVMVKDIAQNPIQGVSMAYTWDKAKAPSTRTTQYFEMVCNRAMLTPGKHTLVFDFTYDGRGFGKGGTGILSVDGNQVATNKLMRFIPFLLPGDETFDVGLDTPTPVDDTDYQVPFPFTRKITKLTFKLGPVRLTENERGVMHASLVRAHD